MVQHCPNMSCLQMLRETPGRVNPFSAERATQARGRVVVLSLLFKSGRRTNGLIAIIRLSSARGQQRKSCLVMAVVSDVLKEARRRQLVKLIVVPEHSDTWPTHEDVHRSIHL